MLKKLLTLIWMYQCNWASRELEGYACVCEFHQREADFILDISGMNGFRVGERPGFVTAHCRRRELVVVMVCLNVC